MSPLLSYFFGQQFLIQLIFWFTQVHAVCSSVLCVVALKFPHSRLSFFNHFKEPNLVFLIVKLGQIGRAQRGGSIRRRLSLFPSLLKTMHCRIGMLYFPTQCVIITNLSRKTRIKQTKKKVKLSFSRHGLYCLITRAGNCREL